MKKLLFLALLLSTIANAQVSQKIAQADKKLVINETTKTIDLDATSGPTYQNSGYTATLKGVTYPVYVSDKGKMFIFMTSKKSGKQYRKYLN